jgi:peptidoglycan/xylan/chitin deacetylase (PgdA/CDA1 family)
MLVSGGRKGSGPGDTTEPSDVETTGDHQWSESGGAMVEAVTRLSWSLPFARVLTSRHPVVLLYHETPRASVRPGINSAVFERHIAFLTKHFDFVAPGGLLLERPRSARPRILLTFDDGFRSNAEFAVPILRRHRAPALFFVSSRHAAPGRYLWFSYLRGLRHAFNADGFSYRGELMDMRPPQSAATIERLQAHLLSLRPHPKALYHEIEHELPPLEDFMGPDEIRDNCAGMSEEQVGELSADPLFGVGAHTVDHPFLTRCEPEEACRQIVENATWLEQVTGSPCTTLAYPAGDYDAGVVRQAKRNGFSTAYAVIPRGCGESMLEIPRVGIYGASQNVLGCKATWGNAMRALRVPVG